MEFMSNQLSEQRTCCIRGLIFTQQLNSRKIYIFGSDTYGRNSPGKSKTNSYEHIKREIASW